MVLLIVTLNPPADHSVIEISFTAIVGALSLSVIVAVPFASPIVALPHTLLKVIVNVSFPSKIVSCSVLTGIVPLVVPATNVNVHPVYV